MNDRFSRADYGALAGWLLLWAAAGWLLYHPAALAPTDVWDFIDFVPVLRPHHGFWGKWFATIHLYVPDGRTNLLFYGFVALNDWLFGIGAVGWAMVRFVLMLLVTAMTWLLLRRLGADRIGAGVGASLFVVGGAALLVWVMLMAEPLALAAAIVSAMALMGVRTSSRPNRRLAIGLGAMLLLLLAKEAAVPLVAPIVILGCCWRDGALRWPTWDRETFRIVGGSVGVVGAVGVAILVARSHAIPTGYGLKYGGGEVTLDRYLHSLFYALLPMQPGSSVLYSFLAPPNAAALILVAGGAALANRRGVPSGRLLAIFGVAAVAAVAGAIVYLPWPVYQAFYAMPFSIGLAALAALAFSEWRLAGRWGLIVGSVLAVTMLGVEGVHAGYVTTGFQARARLHAASAATLAKLKNVDTVLVANPGGARELTVAGWQLRQYAVGVLQAPDSTVPPVRDRPCAEAFGPSTFSRTISLSFSYGCGSLPAADITLVAGAHALDWLTFRMRDDSMRVTFKRF